MMAPLRWLAVLTLLGITCPSPAQTRVTVSQLEQFLCSKTASKESDPQLADLLGTVTLTQQLSPSTLAWIVRTTTPGPQTTEQLQLLASSSVFEAPPASELPNTSAPDATKQQQIIASARKYVTDLLHSFPDFLAVRSTVSFDDAPQPTDRRKQSPEKAPLQFIRQTRREIGYRQGKEIVDSTSNRSPDPPGLTTWGEFGPILKIALADSFKGSVRWSRWQRSETGAEVAVFQYAIPKPASHYLIDFCCYRISEDDPVSYPFRDHPACHGELYIDPATGAVDRITLEAELGGTDPVTASAIAVQYGRVDIGGKIYICPVHAVAISTARSTVLHSADKVRLERHISQLPQIRFHCPPPHRKSPIIATDLFAS